MKTNIRNSKPNFILLGFISSVLNLVALVSCTLLLSGDAIAKDKTQQDCETEILFRAEPTLRRQTREGYWLSQMMTPEDIPYLVKDEIKAVVSLVLPPKNLGAALKTKGIKHIIIPMGSSLNMGQVEKLERELKFDADSRIEPKNILIHCEHGADRTGAVAAYLLATRHEWTIPEALAAVVSPDKKNIEGLKTILRERKFPEDSIKKIERYNGNTAIYSTFGRCFKGEGGHKTTGRFKSLTGATIDVIKKILAGRTQQPAPNSSKSGFPASTQ